MFRYFVIGSLKLPGGIRRTLTSRVSFNFVTEAAGGLKAQFPEEAQGAKIGNFRSQVGVDKPHVLRPFQGMPAQRGAQSFFAIILMDEDGEFH